MDTKRNWRLDRGPHAVAAVVVAAGRGSRFATAEDASPKQYRLLAGRSILARTLDALRAVAVIGDIQCVVHPQDKDMFAEAIAGISADRRMLQPVAGGASRQASVRAGLEALASRGVTHILVHDGVRPFVDAALIERLIAALHAGAPAATAALPIVDTVLQTDAEGCVADFVPRAGLWRAQTPQAFDFERLRTAHAAAVARGDVHVFTDDATLAWAAGMPVRVVPGAAENVKITTPADLADAETRFRRSPCDLKDAASLEPRVGTGYDIHRFVPGVGLMLGGIAVPHTHRLEGHSDADAVLHALTDALLGTLAEGDIGSHFPPSDPRWRGARSEIFLRHAVTRLRACGGRIVHLDVTVICERPKLGPYRDAMRENIARLASVAAGRVSLKATTSERLGPVGREEGLCVLAVASVLLPAPTDEMTI